MKLSQLTPGQKFKLPAPNQQTVFCVIEQIHGNPNALTVAWCAAPNLERLIPKANGTFEHRQDEAEVTFGGHVEAESLGNNL